jgi:hypothetical protein
MADDSYNLFEKIKLQKLKSFLISKDVLSFLLFFLLSAIFWFVNALDKNREITLRVPLQLINLPKEVTVTNNLPDFITVDVKDVGVNLFTYSDQKLKPLNISLTNFQYSKLGQIQIDAATINRYLQSYFLQTTQIISFSPDTLLIEYEKLFEKKVPIKIKANIETKHQFMIDGDIIINPAFVNVYGPEQILDTLRWIETEIVELNNLSDTVFLNLKIKPVPFIRPEINTVKVLIPVTMFTEKNIELPVQAVNLPNYLKIKSFPAFVRASINISITAFQRFKSNDIQVYIDYNEIKGSKSPKYNLKINNRNPHINNIRLTPSEVEYILEKY